MFFLNYLKETEIRLIIFLICFGKIDTQLKLNLFNKATEDDVKYSQTNYVTSAMSLFECCLTCKHSADCGLLNYNNLSIVNNCELIQTGHEGVVVTFQQGWNIYYAIKESSSCTEEWTSFGSSCYRLENETHSWSDAQAKCAEHTNGHLVHISSKEENDQMKKIYESKHPHGSGFIWIGLNDLDVMGTHKWTDGTVLSPADYANWGEGQDVANDEHCIALYRPHDYNWHDFSCTSDYLLSIMCEIDII